MEKAEINKLLNILFKGVSSIFNLNQRSYLRQEILMYEKNHTCNQDSCRDFHD